VSKISSILLFVFFSAFVCNAQTAVDFTATDCDGITNNLSTELNNGKIVVLVWVEPCVGCISDAKAAYDAVMSFNGSNPGKVKYWLIDDIGDTPCGTLASWASTNNIVAENIQIFSNSGDSIKESNYGGTGMPHVVVVGNANHHIYLNILNGSNNGVAITSAINQALTNSIEDNKQTDFVVVYPNPVNERLIVNYSLATPQTITLELMDVAGRIVKTKSIENVVTGKHSVELLLGNEIPTGNYFLKCSTSTESKVFTITKTNH
jgi:hypothetical protein